MKRSEVLKLIEGLFNLATEPNNEFPNDVHAENLLCNLEEIGMLPPKMIGIYDSVPTVTPTGNHEYSYKRGWETEDDNT